ncbi:hypothetical protein [Mucilaginibacter antarcticus]|uniref:hypothetical protein n=1 Tax=Mucilaginibacter antarcticus TaxID=1855725 RepID=UPI00362E8C55
MKQFFKFVLATIVGIIVSTVIIVIIFVAIIGGIVASAGSDNAVNVESNSILHIDLKYAIPERTAKNPLADLGILGFGSEKSIGLKEILTNIKKAKTDDNIKGIFLDESYMAAGQATTEEIRNALLDFKKSKKFIVAYGEVFTQRFYYLASVADKVYINPKGYFEFNGFESKVTFLKVL